MSLLVKIAHLHEHVVAGKRLGRHVRHDPRSFLFPAPMSSEPVTTRHVRKCPIFDQGQLGSCHDVETEVLTDRGWKLFSALDLSEKLATVCPETTELSFETPTRVIRMPFDGELVCAENRSLNFHVTPDHMMLLRRWDQDKKTLRKNYDFVHAQEIGWYAGFLSRVRFRGTSNSAEYALPGVEHKHDASQRVPRPVPMKEWLRFLGVYLADGTLIKPSPKSPNRVQIAGKKVRKKEAYRKVLADIGVHALELDDRFTFENKQVCTALRNLGLDGVKAPQKFVPKFVFQQSAESIRAFLEGHMMGDGCVTANMKSHYTSSQQLAEDLQLLAFLGGVESRISVRAARPAMLTSDGRTIVGNYPEHRVSICERKSNVSIDKKEQIFRRRYVGEVFCAEMPTHHTLVTRRKGKILVSGNCTGNAGLGMMNTEPFTRTDGDEAGAVKLYSEATHFDNVQGVFPPFDTGSSGLAVMKALQKRGWIQKYSHAFGLSPFLRALVLRPGIVGIAWREQMDHPSGAGVVRYKGGVRGGHEIEAIGLDTDTRLVWFANSWGVSWGLQGYFAMSFDDVGEALADNGDACFSG